MALTTEEIKYIRDALDESARPLFFFDDDPDGLSSFLLLYRYKGDGIGVCVKSTPELKVDFARKIDEYHPDTIFILDKPLVSQDFLDKCKGKKVIWLDHHEPQKPKGAKYFNPRVHDDADNRPTSYWAWRITQKDLWIGMTGTVGDWCLPDDITKEFKAQYPTLITEDINRPQDALFNSGIGKIAKMFSFLLKGNTSDVNKSIKILTRIEDEKELLTHTTSRAKLLWKRYKGMDKEYTELLNSINTDDPEIILFTYKETRISFTSDISNELLYLYPERLIIIAREKGGEMKISLRTTVLDLPKILKKALVGIDGYGGGHTHACGGCVKKDQFDEFIENIKNELK